MNSSLSQFWASSGTSRFWGCRSGVLLQGRKGFLRLVGAGEFRFRASAAFESWRPPPCSSPSSRAPFRGGSDGGVVLQFPRRVRDQRGRRIDQPLLVIDPSEGISHARVLGRLPGHGRARTSTPRPGSRRRRPGSTPGYSPPADASARAPTPSVSCSPPRSFPRS